MQCSVEVWTMTKWREINMDQMGAELRRFVKVTSSTYLTPQHTHTHTHITLPISSAVYSVIMPYVLAKN